MKNTVVILAIALLMMGCNSNVKKENAALKAQLKALAQENEMLAVGEIELALTVEAYQEALLEIDKNLAEIDSKHVSVKGQVEAKTVEDDILMHMEHIHGSMTNSKQKLAQMQKNIDKMHQDDAIADHEILALEIALDDATQEIIARDEVIDMLNEVVIAEGIEIAILAEAYEEQAIMSAVLYGALNTAYIVVGTKKELEEYGIITTEGGFLGMGGVKKIAADAEDGLFLPIPIMETEEIDMTCKKAKILTNHPESSYTLSGEELIEALKINDPIAFWDKSDFLVVEIVEAK